MFFYYLKKKRLNESKLAYCRIHFLITLETNGSKGLRELDNTTQ